MTTKQTLARDLREEDHLGGRVRAINGVVFDPYTSTDGELEAIQQDWDPFGIGEGGFTYTGITVWLGGSMVTMVLNTDDQVAVSV